MKTKLANVALAVMLALTATHHSAAQAPASPASASAIAVSDQADADGADHGREAGRVPLFAAVQHGTHYSNIARLPPLMQRVNQGRALDHKAV